MALISYLDLPSMPIILLSLFGTSMDGQGQVPSTDSFGESHVIKKRDSRTHLGFTKWTYYVCHGSSSDAMGVEEITLKHLPVFSFAEGANTTGF